MIKIMFVCHGNICRSPMAEFIFKDLVEKAGLSKDFYIKSSATSTEEIYCGIGNPIYPPAQRELKMHNIPFDDKRATLLLKSDYQNYDYFICMDLNNIRNANRIFGSDYDKKLHRLLEFCHEDRDVSDPWYSGDFSTAYNDIKAGCEALLSFLIKE